MKIREDLEGVVVVTTGPGSVVTLAAGAEVPEGIEVGEHLLATDAPAKGPAKADATEGAAPAEAPVEVAETSAKEPAEAKGPYAAAPKTTRGRK